MAPPTAVGVQRIVDVRQQLRSDTRRWWTFYAVLMTFVLFIGAIAFVTVPQPFSIPFVLLIICATAAFLRPTIGVYLIVFLTLIGDDVTMGWWPFATNMSSQESILYLSNQFILSPLELMIAMTTVAWLLQRLVDPAWQFWRGRLFWPVMIFTGFVFLGLLYGKAKGGDTRVAVFEARQLLYMILVYILVSNLFTHRSQYRRLLYLSFVAVSIQSVFSLIYYNGLPDAERAALESLGEHAATIHMDAFLVFLLAVWMLRCRGQLRWSMVVLAPPIVWAYVLSQRRAAMIALVVGIILLMMVVYFRRRRVFWFAAPVTVVLSLGYVLATWNASGALGLPALATKTVFFPGQLPVAEQGSDAYRQIEAYNLWFTIRANRLFGVGFGNRFLQPIPLPDISFFEFWQYMPHNSVLWVWLKTGFGGFVALIFMFGRAIQRGARSALLVRSDEQAAIVIAGVAYVAMFFVFAYVDIAWDVRSTVFLGFCFALCSDFEAAIDEGAHDLGHVHTHQLASVR